MTRIKKNNAEARNPEDRDNGRPICVVGGPGGLVENQENQENQENPKGKSRTTRPESRKIVPNREIQRIATMGAQSVWSEAQGV